MRLFRPIVRVVLLVVSAAASLRGESPEANTYGTAAVSVLTVPAFAFLPASSTNEYTTSNGERYRLGGSDGFDAAATLPGGAAVTGIQLYGCDTSSTYELNAKLYECGAGVCSNLAAVATGGPAAPGCDFFEGTVSPAHTVDNVSKTYVLQVSSQATDNTTRFRAVRVFYRLQMSPAPATATFADVPTGFLYFRAIEALAAAGITSGCGGGNFCPNQFVTRGEMAKFLASALGLQWP